MELTVTARGLGHSLEVILSARTDTPSQVMASILNSEGVALPDSTFGGGDALATGILNCDQADHPTCTGSLLLELTSVTASSWDGEWTIRAAVAGSVDMDLPKWVTIEVQLAATD
jgi:hypothetical protein